ncbi:MAG: PEP-CTERM sorting domain-containing protein [Burkholderiales bacterium]|nr:PEP-CTERM sorting domain-containing protein [Burkholderiales bacterium]
MSAATPLVTPGPCAAARSSRQRSRCVLSAVLGLHLALALVGSAQAAHPEQPPVLSGGTIRQVGDQIVITLDLTGLLGWESIHVKVDGTPGLPAGGTWTFRDPRRPPDESDWSVRRANPPLDNTRYFAWLRDIGRPNDNNTLSDRLTITGTYPADSFRIVGVQKIELAYDSADEPGGPEIGPYKPIGPQQLTGPGGKGHGWVAPVPEPAAASLLAAGALTLLGLGRRRRSPV